MHLRRAPLISLSGQSRRRRGRDADIPRRRGRAATTRPRGTFARQPRRCRGPSPRTIPASSARALAGLQRPAVSKSTGRDACLEGDLDAACRAPSSKSSSYQDLRGQTTTSRPSFTLKRTGPTRTRRFFSFVSNRASFSRDVIPSDPHQTSWFPATKTMTSYLSGAPVVSRPRTSTVWTGSCRVGILLKYAMIARSAVRALERVERLVDDAV